MTARSLVPVALFAALLGCTPPPEAPEDLEELSIFLFAEFESDEALLAAGYVNLLAFFLGYDAEADLSVESRDGRTWQLPQLGFESMEGLTFPDDINPAAQIPVAVAWRSPFPLADHLPAVALADQTPVEPESSASYDRAFDTPADCFLDGTCDRLECTDTIHRVNALIDLVYEQKKHYRHVRDADGEALGVVSRSWIPERFENDDGDMIDQWFSLNAWVADGDETIRYSTLWGSSNLGLDDEFLRGQVADGIDEAFQNTDAYLAGR